MAKSIPLNKNLQPAAFTSSVSMLKPQADLSFALLLHRSFPFVIQFRQRLAGQFFP